MNKKKELWDVIWKIIKFILTLGLSHITKREEKRKNEMSNPGESK